MDEKTILTRTEGHVGVVQLNRPKALNAVSFEMLDALLEALEQFDADDAIHVILIHGNERAFAAGADIKDRSEEHTSELQSH